MLFHAALEFRQMGLEVVADEVRDTALTGIHGDVVLLVNGLQNIRDLFLDRFRGDALLDVIGLLFLAAPVRFVEGALQRIRHLIGIEDDPAVDVAGRAPDGLDQGCAGAQEPFLVRVEDADQGAFGNVQSLAQQIDADQDVEDAKTQIADDLDTLQGIHECM